MATQYFTPLTAKQRPYVRALAEGKSKEEAKRIARYSEDTSTYQIEKSPSVKAALARLVRQHVPAHLLARKIAEGLEATETKFFQSEGIVTETREVIDWNTRRNYAALAGEWGYDMGKDKGGLNLSLNNSTNINSPLVNVHFTSAPAVTDGDPPRN